jgi:cephalosporin hydroxylase
MLFNRLFRGKQSFDLKSIYEGHLKVTYRGISAVRCPFDYVLYQMIICDIIPDLVIEIGTNMGGGALYIADLMNIIGHGELHTIDINPIQNKIILDHPRVSFFDGGYDNYDISMCLKYKKIIVIEDASHTYEDSLKALFKFAPIVTIGSYYIVEDGIVENLGIEKKYNGGPQKAINEFLATNHNFIVDRHWCDFFGKNTTFNVNGYLKKIS